MVHALSSSANLPRAAATEGSGPAASDATNAEVRWLLQVSVKDGQAANLKALITEMAEAAHANEPGTLSYTWMISDDDTFAEVFEHYADSAAALTHLQSFTENFAARFLTMVDPARYTVYGNPSEALRAEITGFNPIYMVDAGGFSR